MKILDFGLAKLTDISMTRSRTSVGTAAYMAPEQIRVEAVTPATDIWSLGVLFYELLTTSLRDVPRRCRDLPGCIGATQRRYDQRRYEK